MPRYMNAAGILRHPCRHMGKICKQAESDVEDKQKERKSKIERK
jgi:hypothetical protein